MSSLIISNHVPSYLHKGARGTQLIPLDSDLLDRRSIVVGEINYETALNVFLSFQHLTKTDEPIKMFFYSQGGELTAGTLIYDLMMGCINEIHTYCIGRAASMAAILFASGTKGHRYILPHSEVMIHEVLIHGDISASATSISKLSQSINGYRDFMNGILAKHTGRTIEEINESTSYDNLMNAEQAVEFGICDKIVENIF